MSEGLWNGPAAAGYMPRGKAEVAWSALGGWRIASALGRYTCENKFYFFIKKSQDYLQVLLILLDI